MSFTYRTRFVIATVVCIAACLSVALVHRPDTRRPSIITVAAIADGYPEGPDLLTVALTEQRSAYADWLVFLGHAVDNIVAGWTPPPPPVVYPLPRQYVAAAPSTSSGLGNCGGIYPPCSVKARESGGSYTAENPSSSASGAWQFLDSTWGGYGGYQHAADAPPSVQDERAAQLWAGGAGCGHWSAC